MELKVNEWNGRSTTMLAHRKNITLSNSYHLSNYFDKKKKFVVKKTSYFTSYGIKILFYK